MIDVLKCEERNLDSRLDPYTQTHCFTKFSAYIGTDPKV
jgi:hypothetical protein